MSIAEAMSQMAIYGFANTYDAAAASASPQYIQNQPQAYPTGNPSQSYDTLANIGVANPRLAGA
jgi:hypothetical protein